MRTCWQFCARWRNSETHSKCGEKKAGALQNTVNGPSVTGLYGYKRNTEEEPSKFCTCGGLIFGDVICSLRDIFPSWAVNKKRSPTPQSGNNKKSEICSRKLRLISAVPVSEDYTWHYTQRPRQKAPSKQSLSCAISDPPYEFSLAWANEPLMINFHANLLAFIPATSS